MAALPTGTVTFLFTDIQGSTKLWEEYPDLMAVALARHDEILRQAIEGNGGSVFKTVGDAFCAAFSNPSDALVASLAAQRKLLNLRLTIDDLRLEDRGQTGSGQELGNSQSAFQHFSISVSQVNSGQGSDNNGQPLTLSPQSSVLSPNLIVNRQSSVVNPATQSSIPHPPSPILRVRMALHTGVAQERDGDYFGPTINRVARLLSAGHGGQVLLSLATHGLVTDYLPPNVNLRDLGERRLKDLSRPEHIFQVTVPDLPSEFPPLRTLDNRPTNLPAPPTSFIGRENELTTLRALLRRPETRLVTLTGPGGTGKTRLSLAVASDLLDEFEHGVFFVALASTRDPALVPSAIAHALGVKEVSGQLLVDNLKGWLRDKQLLLVLDNFEQVIAAAPLITELLGAAPGLKVLVSSREVLYVYGEQEFEVPPLLLPDLQPLPPVYELSRNEAVALFLQRAQAVKFDFTLTKENAPAIAEICTRLDGLPLAIELAAVRSKQLPPENMLEQLKDKLGARLDLLSVGPRDLPSRQQTLRGAIDWSYHLLDDAEKSLFRKLAVFAGGFTIDDLRLEDRSQESGVRSQKSEDNQINSGQGTVVTGQESAISQQVSASNHLIVNRQSQIVNPDTQSPTPNPYPPSSILLSLLDKSLVRQLNQAGNTIQGETEGEEPSPRFAMLETIREYAWEQLALANELNSTRKQHALHYLELAETAEPELRGAKQQEYTQRLEVEHNNLRAALAWAIETENTETALRLSGALWRFWRIHSHLTEGRKWLEDALALNDYPESAKRQSSIATRKSIWAKALNGAGFMAQIQADNDRATTLLRQSLSLYRQLGDKAGIASTLNILLAVALSQNDYEEATVLQQENLALHRETGNQRGIANGLNNLGLMSLYQGKYPEAQNFFEESLQIHRQLENKLEIAGVLHNLGCVMLYQDEYVWATLLFKESLDLFRNLGDKSNMAGTLEGLAGVAGAQNQAERAARLFGAADALREEINSPQLASDKQFYEPIVQNTRTLLGEEAFEATCADGRAMGLENAITYALEATTLVELLGFKETVGS